MTRDQLLELLLAGTRWVPIPPDPPQRYFPVGTVFRDTGSGSVFIVGDVNPRTGECDCCAVIVSWGHKGLAGMEVAVPVEQEDAHATS